MDYITDSEIKKIVEQVAERLQQGSPQANPVSISTTPSPDKKIAIGADHGGYRLKETLKSYLAEILQV